VCNRIANNANSFGYKTARSALRHPQSQSKVERWNRTISERLAAKHVELGPPAPSGGGILYTRSGLELQLRQAR